MYLHRWSTALRFLDCCFSPARPDRMPPEGPEATAGRLDSAPALHAGCRSSCGHKPGILCRTTGSLPCESKDDSRGPGSLV